jgi:4-amino-4-deoxy-L-arabinose transferase-like glycosyltransferase
VGDQRIGEKMTAREKFDKFMPGSRKPLLALLAFLVTAYSVVRIVGSYSELSQTWDEPYFLATGMQLIAPGDYTYPAMHPPVARLFSVALPYLDGARAYGAPKATAEGNEILHGQGTYWRTLTLARLGILPLYLAGVFLLWSWSKKMYGDEVAFLAVFCYTLIPPILANAGLATSDLPFTTTFLAACYAFWWWLQKISSKRSIVLGIALGVCAATKLTFFLFFPVAGVAILIYEFFVQKSFRGKTLAFSKTFGLLALAMLVFGLTIWAFYGFSVGPAPDVDQMLMGTGSLRSATPTSGAMLPAPEFIGAISTVFRLNDQPYYGYLLGKVYPHGTPFFFPVALAVKTPIALLLAALLATFLIFSKAFGGSSWWNVLRSSAEWRKESLLPLFIAGGLLLSVLPAKLTIGIRHILPIYPFVAMIGALGIRWLWSANLGTIVPKGTIIPITYWKVAVALLMLWMVLSSVSYDPDRIAYINELAILSSPRPVLSNSDLDLGQDLYKLSDTLRAHQVQYFTMLFNGSTDLSKAGLPRFEMLRGFAPPSSRWVAASKKLIYQFDEFGWLQSEQPAAKIGNSMLLYHFTDSDLARIGSKFGYTIAGTMESNAARQESPENLLNLSVSYMHAKRYEDCIAAAKKALALRPEYADAYNNICVANNMLGRFLDGKEAGEEAVRIAPNVELFQSNLKWSLYELNKK